MAELRQLYDEDANPLPGKGATKDESLSGLLHGASQIWIWRTKDGSHEILLQKRAADKRVWPDLWDISAAGHIDVGETPETAAVREIKEEIGLDVDESDLQFIKRQRAYEVMDTGDIENEFLWIYSLQVKGDQKIVVDKQEVSTTTWKSLDDFAKDVFGKGTTKLYTPRGDEYFQAIIDFINAQTKR